MIGNIQDSIPTNSKFYLGNTANTFTQRPPFKISFYASHRYSILTVYNSIQAAEVQSSILARKVQTSSNFNSKPNSIQPYAHTRFRATVFILHGVNKLFQLVVRTYVNMYAWSTPVFVSGSYIAEYTLEMQLCVIIGHITRARIRVKRM